MEEGKNIIFGKTNILWWLHTKRKSDRKELISTDVTRNFIPWRDCHLSVSGIEYCCPDTDMCHWTMTNSQFRSKRPREPSHNLSTYQPDILSDSSSNLTHFSERYQKLTFSFMADLKKQNVTSFPAVDWNSVHSRIVARDRKWPPLKTCILIMFPFFPFDFRWRETRDSTVCLTNGSSSFWLSMSRI